MSESTEDAPRLDPMARRYRWRAAWGCWIWLAMSLTYVLATVLAIPRLPGSVWILVLAKYRDIHFYVSITSILEIAAWILAVQLLLAIYTTIYAVLTPRDLRLTAGERRRGVTGRVALILFIPTFLASFFGAEALLLSIPPQVGRPTLSSVAAQSTLGLFDSPIATVVNGGGIALVVILLIVSRVTRGRRIRSTTRFDRHAGLQVDETRAVDRTGNANDVEAGRTERDLKF